jgi:hypothetical protein
MAKLILLLLILFTTLFPIAVQGSKSPRRTLKTVQLSALVMTFVWAYLTLTYYPQLQPAD